MDFNGFKEQFTEDVKQEPADAGIPTTQYVEYNCYRGFVIKA